MATEHTESSNSTTGDDATATRAPGILDDPQTQQKIIDASEHILSNDTDDLEDIHRAEMLIQSITPE